MLIKTVKEHKGWSGRIRRRGVRRTAREVGCDVATMSRIVNNKYPVGEEMLERLRIATNNLTPIYEGKAPNGKD